VCVRCVFVFLVTALYCFSMDILSEINFMMMMMIEVIITAFAVNMTDCDLGKSFSYDKS